MGCNLLLLLHQVQQISIFCPFNFAFRCLGRLFSFLSLLASLQYAQLGRGVVFDDEIPSTARQRMQEWNSMQSHGKRRSKRSGIRGSRQFRGSVARGKGPSGCERGSGELEARKNEEEELATLFLHQIIDFFRPRLHTLHFSCI